MTIAWGRRALVEHVDWRHTCSAEDLREYDAFGPWIYEIKTESDAPKRFRAACLRHLGARFLLKLPRNVDRRDVRPGMDLYVAVLAVHDHGVTLMRLADEGVVTQDLPWGEVAALESYRHLLDSRWTLLLRDGGAFGIGYSTVSSSLMGKVTDFVRSRWNSGAAPRAGQPGPVAAINGNLFFRNELNAKRASGPRPVEPIHVELPGRYCRDATNRIRLSTGVMFLDAPHELIIVGRDEPTRRFLDSTYAVNSVYVPYAGVTSYALAPPPAGRSHRFHELRLRLDKQVVRQACLVEPAQVLARLAARGLPRTSE